MPKPLTAQKILTVAELRELFDRRVRGQTIRELTEWTREIGKPLTVRQVRSVLARAERIHGEACDILGLFLNIGAFADAVDGRLLRATLGMIAFALFDLVRRRGRIATGDEIEQYAKTLHHLCRSYDAFAATSALVAKMDGHSMSDERFGEWPEHLADTWPRNWLAPLEQIAHMLFRTAEPDPPGSPSGMPNGPDRPASS